MDMLPGIDNALIVRLLDLVGIGVFALSGALMAVRLRQTLITACFFALVTGVGGGSVRDLLIGAPVFWVQDGAIAAVCIAIAFVVWITHERWWEGQLLEWADAVTKISGRTMIEGTPANISRIVPPTQPVMTPIRRAGTGGTPHASAFAVPNTA